PPERSDIQQILMPGTDEEAIVSTANLLKDNDTRLLVFATSVSADLWEIGIGKSGLRFYEHPSFRVLDVGSSPNAFPDIELSLHFDLGRKRFCALASEADGFDSDQNPIGKIYLSAEEYLRSSDTGEILITANRDMLSALSAIIPFSEYRMFDDCVAINLQTELAQTCFTRQYNELAGFARLALSAENGKLRLIDIDALRLEQKGSYTFFAEYYDHYMSHVDYEKWLTMILGWCKSFGVKQLNRILEIACGTANIAEILVHKGFQVDACDCSPFMLHMAAQKLFKPNLFLCSMTEDLPRKNYDLVLCLFDSINYLPRKSDIKLLLKNTWQALNPGALFVFDISTLMNSTKNFSDATQISQVRDGCLVHQASYNYNTDKQNSRLVLFRKSGTVYHKHEENHVQRVYRNFEIIELIASSSFQLLGIFSSETRKNLYHKRATDIDDKYARLFYVLRKEA
ncbi:MAG: class I SAM-dependent methyltransferase, partial [Candidatus Cloacimonadaceae bacterium]|nr:class I SAM-dependent methyltransferase [Candidatus Cloacimonadaceae bacterium]